MKSSFRSLSKPLHAMPSYTNSITHASPFLVPPPPIWSNPLSLSHAHTNIHTHTHPEIDVNTSPPLHPTDSAVLSIPTRAAFTLAILAGAMFAAARVACPLIAQGAHPTFLTAAAACYADAVATTVRCTKLCWSEYERGWERERGQERHRSVGGNRRQIQKLLSEIRWPCSTGLFDGSWKGILAPHKRREDPLRTIQI